MKMRGARPTALRRDRRDVLVQAGQLETAGAGGRPRDAGIITILYDDPWLPPDCPSSDQMSLPT